MVDLDLPRPGADADVAGGQPHRRLAARPARSDAPGRVKALDVEKTLKWIGAVVALGGLALGIANYLATVRRDAETRNLQARKQYLTRQLDLYTDATRAAAKLATARPDSAEYLAARVRFWELYWGELSMVESRGVEAAMKNMGDCLNGTCVACSSLARCSLDLAHACRRSLAESWNVPDWRY